jgi:hypothetical protein
MEPPGVAALEEKGIADLYDVFQSDEWKDLSTADAERELTFMMHLQVAGRECMIRGRMDALVVAQLPRIVDYKYANWQQNAEVEYELQMATYCLATMKALGVQKAVGELWFLKSPMKVIRREFTRSEAETTITRVLRSYLEAQSSGEWPMAERAYCDSVSCGFRERCWAK